ncbi:MAG: tryptophan synthase subunit alpha [Prevotella sp.]|nr:tryptophan synthase subunit alpha [Prevotella sp.]
MNRIDELFKRKSKGILTVYFCAGHPSFDSVVDIIKALEKKGIDMVEIGIPFSDPMADGPVIQSAATKALKEGMSLRKLFSILHDIRDEVKIPLVFMGYLNPIMQFGFENFCKSCKDCGIDGVIIPDLPFNDYMESYKSTAIKYDIRTIMLITPETSQERIRLIDENTDGFIYMVSSASITGAQNRFDEERQKYFNWVNQMNLKNPRLIGFGISNKQTWESASENAAGGIIGSKFISLLEEEPTIEEAVEKLLEAISS